MWLNVEFNVNQFGAGGIFYHLIGFRIEDDVFFFHLFQSFFDFDLVVAKLCLLGKSEISNDGGQKKMIRFGQARLRVMVRHSFVKQSRNHAFIAHHLLVVDESETSLFDAFGNEGRKPDESLLFIIFPLESQSLNRAEINFNLRVFGFQFDSRSR